MAEVPVPILDLANNAQHFAAHDAIVEDVKTMMLAKQSLMSAAGRRVTLLEREIATTEISLKNRFNALWGFTTEVDDLILPGQ